MIQEKLILGVLEPKNCPHGSYSLKWILMSDCEKNFVKLPWGSHSHLTSSQTVFLGTSMSSKTPGKDLKEVERERVKIFDIYGVLRTLRFLTQFGMMLGGYENP